MRAPFASRGHFSSSMKRCISVCIATVVTSAARVNTITDGWRSVSPGSSRKCVFTIPAERENSPFSSTQSARQAPLHPSATSSPVPSGKSNPIHGIHCAEERPSHATSEKAFVAPSDASPNFTVTGSKSRAFPTVPRRARRVAPAARRVIRTDLKPSTISVGSPPAHTSSGRYSRAGKRLYAFSVERSTSFPSGLFHSRTVFVKPSLSSSVRAAAPESIHVAAFPA